MAKKKKAEEINGVINGLLRQWGLTRASREQMVFALWDRAVGDLARHAQPLEIKNGRLTVSVQDSVWMQQLHFQRDEIKKNLNRLLTGTVVREVKLTTRSFVEPRPPSPPAPLPELAPALLAEARAAVEVIQDPELREQVLGAFLALARHRAPEGR